MLDDFSSKAQCLPARRGWPRLPSTEPPVRWISKWKDGRVDFKEGENKKPFAITDLSAQLSFDPARDYLRFRLVGYPIRSDLPLPTPGAVEVDWGVDSWERFARSAECRGSHPRGTGVRLGAAVDWSQYGIVRRYGCRVAHRRVDSHIKFRRQWAAQ